jgi:hypothetical protein
MRSFRISLKDFSQYFEARVSQILGISGRSSKKINALTFVKILPFVGRGVPISRRPWSQDEISVGSLGNKKGLAFMKRTSGAQDLPLNNSLRASSFQRNIAIKRKNFWYSALWIGKLYFDEWYWSLL